MDKRFLDKVLNQIVRETEIDHDKERVYTPFSSLFPFLFFSFSSFSYLSPLFPPHYFSHHCREVYGLNEDEIDYVWRNYQRIIKDKINNGL